MVFDLKVFRGRLPTAILGTKFVVLLTFLLAACQPLQFVFLISEANTISGKVIFREDNSSLISCDAKTVSLYSVGANAKKDVKLAETPIQADGSYRFQGVSGVEIGADGSKSRTNHLIEYTCGDEVFQRFVTGPESQDLAIGPTLFSWLSQTGVAHLVPQKSASSWEQFYRAFLNAASMSESFSILSQEPYRSRFHELFGVGPEVLKDALPEIRNIIVATNFKEGVSEPLSVQAVHWWPEYGISYEWRIGAKVLSRESNFTFTPSANSQGDHDLRLVIGQDKGTGEVDLNKPFIEKVFDIAIENTQPATAPPVVLVSPQVTNSTTVQLKIQTGPEVDGRAQNCASFSNLALAEEAFPATGTAPLLASSYTIDCTDSPEQNLIVTLSGVEGIRVLRLWAMDASGLVSFQPSEVTVIYDKTPPQIEILSPVASGLPLKGGSDLSISWMLNEPNAATNSVTLEYSVDGGTSWTTIASSLPNTGSHNWLVPSQDTNQAKIRVRATDLAGNEGEAVSEAFSIDSTPPDVPGVTLASGKLSNSRTVQLNVDCDSDFAKVFLSESAATPDSNSPGWLDCSALISYEVSSGDGLKTIYVWSKDSAGNVSTNSTNVSMTLDQTPPVIELTSLNSGVYPAGSTQLVTWTITDAYLVAEKLDIYLSEDGGFSWTLIAQEDQGVGFKQIVLPEVDTGSARIRLHACDVAGNCSDVASVADFVIDNAAPVLKSVLINDGALTTNLSMLRVKVDVEGEHGSVRVLIKEAAIDGDCQSVYVDAGWLNWTDSSQVFLLPTAPVDGDKKICVWAKDEVGHVSVIDPSEGTPGKDSATIRFEAGNLPEIMTFTADGPGGSRTVQANEPITITWSAEDVEGLEEQPVSFAYTTDNQTWLDIYTKQPILDPENITWVGNVNPSDNKQAYGAFTWPAPTSGYFKLRVVARDKAGNNSLAVTSNTFNTGSWSIYLGSRDRGDGGVGRSATLFVEPLGKSYAVDPKTGDIYAIDGHYGIRKWDAATGRVSTFIKHGATNFVSGQPLNANSRVYVDRLASLFFDSKGHLIVSVRAASDLATAIIYSVDLETKIVTHYAGGGIQHEGGYPADQISIVAGVGITIDEEDSLYFFTSCDGNAYLFASSAVNILKIPRNPDGTAGLSEKIIGDCTRGTVTNWGQAAVNSTAGTTGWAYVSGLSVWERGNAIYVALKGGQNYKIINGVLYKVNLPQAYKTKWLTYNRDDGHIYMSNSTGGITKITPNLSGDEGEVHTVLFTGNGNSPGCSDDGVDITSWCGFVDMPAVIFSGTMFFAHGAQADGPSAYSIKIWDREQKVRTIFGASPFFGEGKHRLLARGNFSGIYYKKASEPHQDVFPEGLYFTEVDGMVLGYVNPDDDRVSVVWGNQLRKWFSLASNQEIGKDVNMGGPFWGGSGYPLTFDANGLPILRVDHAVVRIKEDKKVERYATGSMRISDLPEEASVNSGHLWLAGGYHNFTLKGSTLFTISSYPEVGRPSPMVAIRTLELFPGGVVKTIIGGNYIYDHQSPGSADSLEGDDPNHVPVKDLPIWYQCAMNGACFLRYDASTDRLYFSEDSKLRYIENPTDPLSSKLRTLLTSSGSIRNFILKEDGSQLWYFTSDESLICYDFSSGKSWCDNSTNHFPQRNAMGVTGVGARPNGLTWLDDRTLLVSTSSGEILRFDLPD